MKIARKHGQESPGFSVLGSSSIYPLVADSMGQGPGPMPAPQEAISFVFPTGSLVKVKGAAIPNYSDTACQIKGNQDSPGQAASCDPDGLVSSQITLLLFLGFIKENHKLEKAPTYLFFIPKSAFCRNKCLLPINSVSVDEKLVVRM